MQTAIQPITETRIQMRDAKQTKVQNKSRVVSLCAATLAAWCVLGTLAAADHGDVAIATSPQMGLVQPAVVLTWNDARTEPGQEDTIGYNLYRKIDPDAPYPNHPINQQPIAPLTDCVSIAQLIWSDWDAVSEALASPPESPGGLPQLFNPCDLHEVRPGREQYASLQMLARARWTIATAIGQGYRDANKLNDQLYIYELRGVNAQGEEVVLKSDVWIVAGVPQPVVAPDDLVAHAGDSRILLTWGERPEAAAFRVWRADSALGPYYFVSESASMMRIAQDLEGAPIVPDNPASTVNGLLDHQRWDATGDPIPHLVNGSNVQGPSNGKPYWYRVASLDLLGQEGPPSAAVQATAVDLTPPHPPSGVQVTAKENLDGLEVRWFRVHRDEKDHPEAPHVPTYRVYRFENGASPFDPLSDPQNPVLLGTLVHTLNAPAIGPNVLTFVDTDPVLRHPFGEKTYWYRVLCEDAVGHQSDPSGAATGFLKDITAPATPNGLGSEGFEEHIRVTWSLNTEPDMDHYQIYRSLCDAGEWPCPESVAGARCRLDWVLVGKVLHDDAETDPDGPHFDDYSVPEGSPICYAYLVKAVDESQNASGCWPPCPTKTPPSDPSEPYDLYVCQRLRDTTPPDAPVITALQAHDSAIRVEWVGPPIQDVGAYYVYRSDVKDGEYNFVGGLVVKTQQTITQQLPVPPNVGCEDIPLETNEMLGTGSFLDEGAPGLPIDPKKIYWYRVLGVDQTGNISPVESAAPVSTYTFSTRRSTAPAVTVTASSDPCGLLVSWNPAFNTETDVGFAVLRSPSENGAFRQIGSRVTSEGQIADRHVLRGTTYWYKVVRLETNGKRSFLSPATSGVVPQP